MIFLIDGHEIGLLALIPKRFRSKWWFVVLDLAHTAAMMWIGLAGAYALFFK